MKENFDIFLTEILKHEGGYVNHPKDAGGPTNKGITLVNFQSFVKPGGTIDDLKKLTDAQAGVVYRRNYWNVVKGDDLPSGLDLATGDYGVNSGNARPVKALQKLVGVAQDGKMGPLTLAAIKKHDTKKLINDLCDERLAFMKRAKNTKTGELLWPTFGRGWQRRVDDVRVKSLSLVGNKAAPETKPEPKNSNAAIGGIIIAAIVAIGAWLKSIGIIP